jgi:uncharacterized protein (DUF433 family)
VVDPRTLPAYSYADAARFIGASAATLRSWFKGRTYPTKGGRRRSPQLLQAAGPDALSFLNLVQAHVLQGIRLRYHIPMHRVRTALQYLADTMGNLDLLAAREFFHDGEHLLLKIDGSLISLSERGQTVSEGILEQYLRRIEYAGDGLAARLRPVAQRHGQLYEPRHIVIDPRLAFGKPCIDRIGVKVDVVAERFIGGETIGDLSADYGAEPAEIEDAIRWATRRAA